MKQLLNFVLDRFWRIPPTTVERLKKLVES